MPMAEEGEVELNDGEFDQLSPEEYEKLKQQYKEQFQQNFDEEEGEEEGEAEVEENANENPENGNGVH